MIMVNIYEAKTKLSEFLEAAANGERVVICKHNQPVAELRALAPTPTAPRDLAPMYPGQTIVTPEFFDALSPEEIAVWEGTEPGSLKVAERHGGYGTRSNQRRKRKARP